MRPAGPGTDTIARDLDVGPSPALTAVVFQWNAALWAPAALGAVIGLRPRTGHHRDALLAASALAQRQALGETVSYHPRVIGRRGASM